MERKKFLRPAGTLSVRMQNNMYIPKEPFDYTILCRQGLEIIDADPYFIPSFSNLSALLMSSLPDLNWAGFYFLRGTMLVVGQLKGKPACVHIPEGKGVCGAALAADKTMNVPDVHAFPGHIACDSASRSELVIPMRHPDGRIFGVLDMDSPCPARFTEEDRKNLEDAVRIIEQVLEALRIPF